MKLIMNMLDPFINEVRSNSLWPLTFGASCCAIEMMAASASDYDIARFGSEVFRVSPRQADLMIVAGTITHKMAPSLIKLYEQMAEPKYVIAMGACTISGGVFNNDSYNVINGIDKLIPVDIYLPGCPPKPEALLDALLKLKNKIKTENIDSRRKYLKNHKVRVAIEGELLVSANLELEGA